MFRPFHNAIVVEHRVFSGNAVVINSPSDFGHYMHYSTVYHHKFVRRICRIWKDSVAWSLNCKDRAKHLFCDKYSWLMAIRKRRIFVVTFKKHEIYIFASLSETYSLNILYGLYFLKMERFFEGILWQTFLINV
jgi:hypothetical protein